MKLTYCEKKFLKNLENFTCDKITYLLTASKNYFTYHE